MDTKTLTRGQRLRIVIAQRLLRGTGAVVAERQAISTIQQGLGKLSGYVQHSGGLRDLRRIRAWSLIEERTHHAQVMSHRLIMPELKVRAS